MTSTSPHSPASCSASAEAPAARLARWVARDEEIGLAAQRDELRRQLAARDHEIADLRARLEHLGNVAAQSRIPSPLVPSPQRRSLLGRMRRVVARLRG